MAQDIVQAQEAYPVMDKTNVASAARGIEDIAQTLGKIADRSMVQATDYVTEASKSNLLQTHAMLQDVEAQSKIEMYRNPEHAVKIAENAESTVSKIKSAARLNREDRSQLDYMAKGATRGLSLTAAEKEISLTRERAKFNALSTLGDTLQSVRRDIFTNPEQADALIDAQYKSIAGLVSSGTITAVEAANIHKQFTAELDMARELVKGMRDGVLSAADINTMHATAPGNVPLDNADLPIDHGTAMNTDHYFGQLNAHDLKAKMASGERLSPRALASIKSIDKLDEALNYGSGAARATGEINAGTSFVQLQHNLDDLKKKGKSLTLREQGYKDRLNNFFVDANKPGAYQNYIAGMPEGARAYHEFAQTQALINSDVINGTPEQAANAKAIRTQDNYNNLITKAASIGVGMHYPDHLRQPIPLQILQPIQSGFDKGGDVISAIKNIQYLSPKNRVYAMNAFPGDYRKQQTVYEIGNLADKADAGFLVNLLASQQVDSLGAKGQPKEGQQKFLQLEQGREGYSDKKLASLIGPKINEVTTYLSHQPNGGALVSAKIDQALRYVKKVATDHNDANFEHVNEYINDFSKNMGLAYGVRTGFNFVMDTNSVPLDENEMQVLASHSLNDVRNKLLEYRTPQQVEHIFSVSPPIIVSSPGGRLMAVFPDGQAVPDKYNHPAFSELYSEDLWRNAEHDSNATIGSSVTINPLFGEPKTVRAPSAIQYLRGSSKMVRPEVEGNIDLENRPKVWNDKGQYQTIKTITREFDGKTVLLPTIINGKQVSVKEATEHYKKTGEHLGVFKNQKDADKYDKQLHARMGWLGETNKWEGK